MLIQIILIAIVIFILLYFLKNNSDMRVRAWKRLGFLLFAATTILAIVYPQLLTDVAHFVGVGRGADLLLYLLALSFIFVVLNIYIKFKRTEQTVAKLAREIAILKSSKGK